MGNPFSTTTPINYNTNPPSDDGAQTTTNRIQWSTQKTKLADPIFNAFNTSETNTQNAFQKIVGGAGVTSTAVNYGATASDQGHLIKCTAAAITVTTPDATVVASPFVFAVVNISTGTITVAGANPGVQQNVDGVASIILQPGQGIFLNTDGTNWFTHGQLPKPANNTVLGNISGAPATVVPLTLAGFGLTGTTIKAPNPPNAAFGNLSIKVATTTTVAVAADNVTTTDGTSFQTTALSGTINLGTNGVANALDTGTIAAATWYAIWAIAKADGTTAALASTSFTAPTMPAGYTFKARIGAVTTASAVAQLMGTWQLGRRAQYVVGLAQTALTPVIANGVAGTYSASSPALVTASVSAFVPSTASRIEMSAASKYNSGAQSAVLVAPNTSWGGVNKGPAGTGSNVWPLWLSAGTTDQNGFVSFLLEATTVAWASSAAGGALACLGWEDNI